jgi:hypothetical protein
VRRGKVGFTWYEALYFSGNKVEVHHFTLDADPRRSNYTALTSIGWFHHREFPADTSVLFENLIFTNRMESMRQQHPDHVYSWRNDPHFYHSSLWDFYAAIGYNHKTKKWGKRAPSGPILTREQLAEICLKVDAHYADAIEVAVRS